MRRPFASMLVLALAAVVVGCSQATPPPAPTSPPKAAQPTSAPAAPAAQSTSTPAAPAQPTATPAPKVNFPEKGKTITMIVPWDAGGASDVGMRLLASEMEKVLGVPVQVVNKPGGGTQVGLTELTKAKPDGYTIGNTNLPTTQLSYIDPERKAPYGRKDFAPIANQVWDPGAIAVAKDSPFKTLKDLVDAAKANPEKIKASTTGFMVNTHMDLLLFSKAAGVKFAVVHFSGGAPATTALLGGHVDVSCQTAGNYPSQYKSGDVRLLGIMDSQRSKFFPNVPTMKEQGYDVVSGSARGLSAPASTPKEIVDILSAAVKKAMDSPDLKAKMDEMALEQRFMDSQQFGALWDDMAANMSPLLDLARSQQ